MRTINITKTIATVVVIILSLVATTTNAQVKYTEQAKRPEYKGTTHGGCFYFHDNEKVNCKGFLIKAGGLYDVSGSNLGGTLELGYRFPKFLGALHTRIGGYAGIKTAEMDGMKFDQLLTGAKFYLDLTPHSVVNFYVAVGFQYNQFKIEDKVPVSWLDNESKSDDTVDIYSGDNKHNLAPTGTVGISVRLSKHIHASADYTYVPIKINTPMGSRSYNQHNIGAALAYHF